MIAPGAAGGVQRRATLGVDALSLLLHTRISPAVCPPKPFLLFPSNRDRYGLLEQIWQGPFYLYSLVFLAALKDMDNSDAVGAGLRDTRPDEQAGDFRKIPDIRPCGADGEQAWQQNLKDVFGEAKAAKIIELLYSEV
jgi:hypothetical protein